MDADYQDFKCIELNENDYIGRLLKLELKGRAFDNSRKYFSVS